MSLLISKRPPETRADLALADERMQLDWTGLDEKTNRLVNGLVAMSWPRSRRAAVFAPNSGETVMAYLGCLMAGISSVPVSYHLTPGEVAYILEDSQASVVFVGPETAERGLEAARLAGVDTVIGWRCEGIEGVQSWENWLDGADAGEPPAGMAPAPHLHYTSGTTGKPKGTETPPAYFPKADTVGEFIALMQERRKALPEGPGIAVGPLYHTGPLTMVRALAGGAPLVVASSFDAEAILSMIERFRIAATVMVPTHFQRLLALPKEVREKYDIGSLKRVAHTGAACPRDVKKQMIDWFGPVIVEAYGGTEAGTTTMITSEEWLRKPGSVGRAVEPFEAVIYDDAGEEMAPYEVGRLYFRDKTGRGIIYHNDPAKTAEAHIAPGIFTLGEMAYLDDEGYVFITDRVSDMIVSGGVNIYPAEAEQVLLNHEDVADVAVIGVPNTEMGEEVKALVVPKDIQNPPSAEALNAFCRKELAGFKCPRSYEFLEDIGRNAMGKVNKRDLKKKYWPTSSMIGG